MSTHTHIDRICCVAIVLAMLLTVAFMNGSALGIQAGDGALGYEDRLFDTSTVHTIDIVMDDWEGFLEGCTDEEYVLCDVVIDGESFQNVAIRAKGNTSLTQVEAYGNDRYSFKIEFDHYDSSITYHGLDKLSLNNIIQDNTYMKDYLTYRMMDWFGVDAPLCSYVYITVNGEDWGLYLAVEGVEDAFLERNYGSDSGALYKPDSMSMGGGRGNGGQFDLEDWMEDGGTDPLDRASAGQEMAAGTQPPGMDGGTSTTGEASGLPETRTPDAGAVPGTGTESGTSGNTPTESLTGDGAPADDGISGQRPDSMTGGRQPGGMGGGAMGSSDVSLIYTDDDYDSYANIFDNAKTDITDADKDRLIDALKQLNQGENLESVVDIDEVLRYFVVHNFVCNFDSYTGSMIHNYYLYEQDGQLSMIPWDYNLAFGGFQGAQDAAALVNYPIDTPVSGGTVDSRPMLAWIFADEAYTELYHQYFQEFIAGYFDSGYFAEMMAETEALIAPYVEQDPTKFCTYEEFETGIAALKEFCLLRAESISGQLAGTILSTDEGQSQDDSALVDASGLNISDMGTMNNGGGMGPGNGAFDRGQTAAISDSPADTPAADGARAGEDAAEDAPVSDGIAAFGENAALPAGMPEDGAFPENFSSIPRTDAPADRVPGQGPVTRTAGETTIPLLAASGAVLLAGLLIAAFYRKRA